jgi:hypothetical protein
MSDQDHDPHESGGFDREIGIKGLVLFVVGLVALLLASGLLMYLLSAGLREARVAADPPLPKLPEARQSYTIEGPLLQAAPPADMAAWRAQEEEVLNRWGWTDEANEVATVPIERAMELLVEQRATPPVTSDAEGGS